MEVKIHTKPKGIPRANAAVSWGEQETLRVFLRVSAIDSHEMPSTCTTLRMSPTEARDLAARIIKEADAAEAQRF